MDAPTLHSVGAVQGLSHAKRALLAAVYTVTVACNGWVILALKPSTEQVFWTISVMVGTVTVNDRCGEDVTRARSRVSRRGTG